MEEDEKKKKAAFRKKVRAHASQATPASLYTTGDCSISYMYHRMQSNTDPLCLVQMEKEVSDFIQDSVQQKRKYNPMGKIERSIL